MSRNSPSTQEGRPQPQPGSSPLSQLIETFTPYIRARAAQFAGIEETDDLVQEGLMGLAAAIDSFDPARGSFAAYARRCINNSILSAVRTASRLKQRPLSQSLSLSDDTLESRIPALPSAEEEVLSQEALSALQAGMYAAGSRAHQAGIAAALSPLEHAVLEKRLLGLSNQTIAGQMGIPVKSVSNAVGRARSKLRQYMPK